VRQARAEPRPEDAEAGHLGEPPAVAAVCGTLGQEAVRVGVEIEASERHDDVVERVLVLEEEARRRVEEEGAAVVRAPEAVRPRRRRLLADSLGGRGGDEEGRVDGEEGHVLDVRVVLRVVRDEVVHVVVVAPPAQAEAAERRGDKDANGAVDGVVACDAAVAGIVRRERHLVPEEAEAER
jgi:hypothetical protein